MLIEEFKKFTEVKTARLSGIYIIFISESGKYYIGSAVSLANRKATHFKDLRRGKHKNSHLQNAYDKYGESSFNFYLAEYVDRNELISVEQFYFDKYKPYDNNIGYNISKVAGSTLGVKPSAETRRKQSISAKNRKNKVPSGAESWNAKLTWERVHNIREKYKTGKYSQKRLSLEFGISRRSIGDILNNITYKNGSGKTERPTKMNLETARKVRKEFSQGLSRKELKNKYQVSYNTIRFILTNKTWKEK